MVYSNNGKSTFSEKIDKFIMNRFLALPIFFIIMFLVYYVSISTVGTRATDFVNDGLFADGFSYLEEAEKHMMMLAKNLLERMKLLALLKNILKKIV